MTCDDKIEDDKKYRDDTIFQMLEKNYLTLRDEDVKKANKFFKDNIEKELIPLMRQNELFDLLFRNFTYGGSFYKGTRYGKPEEFDLDLVDTDHSKHGFVKIKVDPQAFDSPNWLKHKNELSKWLTKDNYLNQNEFRNWMEKVITTTISKLLPCINDPNTCLSHTHMSLKKSGPAFTLNMQGCLRPTPSDESQKNLSDLEKSAKKWVNSLDQGKLKDEVEKIKELEKRMGSENLQLLVKKILGDKGYFVNSQPGNPDMNNTKEIFKIDIDFVPVIKFDNVPLGNGYKTIDGENKTWMAIAKPLSAGTPDHNILWRLSFYEPEKEFLQGEIKPVIRMLKKFRDTMKWNSIASYYLETFLYNELERHKYEMNDFLRSSKTNLFVFALKKLQDALENHYLPYFWNKNYNLLKDISEREIYNYSNRLKRIIQSIESCIADEGRLILAEILLESSEVDQFKKDYADTRLSKLRL